MDTLFLAGERWRKAKSTTATGATAAAAKGDPSLNAQMLLARRKQVSKPVGLALSTNSSSTTTIYRKRKKNVPRPK